MKTFGLVGGTSWVSSVEYYTRLNEQINQRLGGNNFAKCILYSFNFAEIEKITKRKDWDALLKLVIPICRNLTATGAECIMLCANTMHVIAEELRDVIDIPLIHIAEATAAAVERQHIKKVGLLGTKFTMELDFFKKKLLAKQIEAIIPTDDDRKFIHATIFDELGKEIFKESTKKRYLEIIGELASKGAGGIILGCTEIPLLIKQTDTPLPLFDTLEIHVEAGVKFAFDK
jgi:aspartate racemase